MIDPEEGDRLVIEIDGPGASPETADPGAVLELVSALVALIAGNAKESEVDLTLAGLRITKKCIRVSVGVSAMSHATECAAQALRQVAGVSDVPRGLGGYVSRVREATFNLPRGQAANVIVGPWVRPVAVGAERPRPMDSMLSIRATPIRVGGNSPKARFTSPLESVPFTLDVSKGLARDIGKVLYQPLDIRALVQRDADRAITGGKLTSFRVMDTGDPETLWRDWYRSVTEPGEDSSDQGKGDDQ